MPVAVSLASRSRHRVAKPIRGRQARGVRTEEAILEATLRLIAAHGVRGTSLDAVADEVGVAKSSVLWHFGSKEGLLLRVAERVLEQVALGPAKDMLALPTLGARVDAIWRFFCDTLRERPEIRRLALWLILECVEERPEIRARLQRLYRSLRDLFEAGLRDVVADAGRRQRIAVVTAAMFDGIFLQWLLDPDAVDLDALGREIVDANGSRRVKPRRSRKEQ